MAENIENNSGFGLPEVTMKPLAEAAPPKPPVQRTPRRPQKKSNAPLIIGLFLGTVVIAAAIWWFMNKKKTDDLVTDTDMVEDVMDDTTDDGADEITYDADAVIDETAEEVSTTEEVATTTSSTTSYRKRGRIANVTSRTGRAYIIAGSFIDVDLANDYGKKLARRGINTKIISPEGDNKFFRLSVADYGSIAAAARNLNRLKATYGDNLWVIKH